MKKAIFFDRDGIVNHRLIDKYVLKIEEFNFIKDFFKLFKLLKQKDYVCVLVTNQQCVGKNLISVANLNQIHAYMQKKLFEATNYCFDKIYFSPDLADSGSKTRKPETGMFLQAIKDFDICAADSFTIGDSISDVIAGKKVGTTTILVSDNLSYTNQTPGVTDYIFPDIANVISFFQKILI